MKGKVTKIVARTMPGTAKMISILLALRKGESALASWDLGGSAESPLEAEAA